MDDARHLIAEARLLPHAGEWDGISSGAAPDCDSRRFHATATSMGMFIGTRTLIGTGAASIGTLPCAVGGGAVVGMATAKVAAGNGRRAATSAGAFHVFLGGAAQPYPKWLPVYFASGGSMTASGLPIPGAVSFSTLEPLEVGGLTSVARPSLGPRQ